MSLDEIGFVSHFILLFPVLIYNTSVMMLMLCHRFWLQFLLEEINDTLHDLDTFCDKYIY